MRLDIHFRHMDRSESVEDFVTERLSQAVGTFLHRHDAHVQVWLVSDLNLTNRGTGNFICEIEIRYPRKRHLFIHKSSPDMHTAILAASEKLETLLDEAGKKTIDNRKHRDDFSNQAIQATADEAQADDLNAVTTA